MPEDDKGAGGSWRPAAGGGPYPPGEIPIVNPVIPPDVEELLQELMKIVPEDVEDTDAGIRYQYKIGVLSKEDIAGTLDRVKKTRYLIDHGLWKPLG